ncbi:M16 family metallopeptidase [Amycolatopsis pigmentata]|uniref:M16 family metallopeptidase n=1 Tax=Amycolatopsis pigmentata TaxID=450801 RepID=A0ABW5G147_9PSEU
MSESPPLTRLTLDNGLRVVVAENRRVPAVAVNLWYFVGSRNETAGRTGLAHLFEHLMFQGSKNVPNGEHFTLITSLGGTLNATTSFDRTNYFETVPAHALELALWLEADRMATLPHGLTQENLDNQRDVVANERRERMDNVPYGTALENLVGLLFDEGHPYHHMPIGSMADLRAASLSDIHDFFGKHYTPANAVLSVVGDVDAATAADLCARYFGDIPGAPPPARPAHVAAMIDAPRHLDLVEPVPAPAIYLGFVLPEDGTAELDAATVAVTALGRGLGARLHRRLVRTERQAQSASFNVIPLVGGASLAVFAALAVPGASLADIEAGFRAELELFAKSAEAAHDVARAKALLERDRLAELSTLEGVADELSGNTCLFDAPERAYTTVSRLGAVTVQDARNAVAKYLLTPGYAAVRYQTEGASR